MLTYCRPYQASSIRLPVILLLCTVKISWHAVIKLLRQRVVAPARYTNVIHQGQTITLHRSCLCRQQRIPVLTVEACLARQLTAENLKSELATVLTQAGYIKCSLGMLHTLKAYAYRMSIHSGYLSLAYAVPWRGFIAGMGVTLASISGLAGLLALVTICFDDAMVSIVLAKT